MILDDMMGSKNMREILFRGKRVDDRKWVYGYYATGKGADDSIVHYIYEPCGIFNRIVPDTVGQFTGICDEDGERIFEGDILKWDEREWGCPYSEVAAFDYALLNVRKNDWSEWCTVIGNKWDNPELLNP